MRGLGFSLSLTLSLVCACDGEDHEQGLPTVDGLHPCEFAQELTFDTLRQLRASSPRCVSDQDCVRVPIKVSGGGTSLDLCDHMLHREVAAQWDPAAIGALLSMRIPPSDLGCQVIASCRSFAPACRAGVCIGVHSQELQSVQGDAGPIR